MNAPEPNATPDVPPTDVPPTDVPPTAAPSAGIEVQTPRFAEMQETAAADGTSMDRFYDVNVTVWAELGRISMPLGHLVQIGEGTVMKLERPVSAPVDLMAQGVRVAKGEVVVVDDCFAIRVKEIEPSRKTG